MKVGVVGATGEVGKEVVRHVSLTGVSLVQPDIRVILYVRSKLEFENAFVPDLKDTANVKRHEDLKTFFDTRVEQVVIDFDNLPEDLMKDVDVCFSCLGTTYGKAGAEGFKKVDYDYVVNTAKLAHKNGVKRLLVCSSIGANSKSWFLYLQTKGATEDSLKGIGFEYLGIMRPGMLMCDRKEKRPLESIMRFIFRVDPFNQSIATADVAAAMVELGINLDLATAGTVGNGATTAIREFNMTHMRQLAKDLHTKLQSRATGTMETKAAVAASAPIAASASAELPKTGQVSEDAKKVDLE